MSQARTVLLLLVVLGLVACEETSEPETGATAVVLTPTVAGAPSADTATPTSPPTATPSASVTATAEPTPRPITVSGVVDGDTIDVLINGVEHRVRLILVDTAEIHGGVECFGPEASAFVEELLRVGTAVTLERDVSETDRFDRLLRYMYLTDGRMVNELLLSGGYAQVATFPPDVKYVDRFLELQRQARDAGRGLWSACVATPTATAPPPPPPPPSATATVAPTPDRAGCHASYPTVCIPPPPPDLDCGEISFRRFRVIGSDPHRFDGDRDGIGCES